MKTKAITGMVLTLFFVSIMLSNMVSVKAMEVDIAPATLNVNNNAGEWITAYIEPTVMFKDTFTRTEWTPHPAGTWQPGYSIGGVWAFENGEYSGQVPAYTVGLSSAGDSMWVNYIAEVKIYPIIASGAPDYWRAGLLFRYIDENNWYMVHTYDHGIRLVKRISGVDYVDLPWYTDFTVPSNTWHTLKVVVNGDPPRIQAYINDVLKIDYQDSGPSISAGKIALGVWDEPYPVHIHFDDVIVADLFGTVLFEDHFDWQVILGEWKVLDYEYQQIANWYIPGARSFAGDTAWTNYAMIAKVKITDDGWGGLLLRGNADGNTYYELYLQRGGRLQLVKTVAGVRTGIINPYVGAFADQWWYIKAVIYGGHVMGKAWPISGTEPTTWQVDWSDTTPIASGRIGLITFSWSTTQLPVYFDDVLATDIDINDINVDTIQLWHTDYIATVVSGSALFGDHDGDGIPDLTIKFDRAAVVDHLRLEGITSGDVELTIKAQVYGVWLDDSDSVRVIAKGKATF